MLFQNAGAYAALLLFSRGALGAAINANATATDDTCEADETITSTIYAGSATNVASAVPSPSGAPLLVNGTESNPGPSFNGTLGAAGAQQASGLPLPAASGSAGSVVTEVVYTTNIHTLTSCAPTVTNCPAASSALSTEVVAVSTTVRTLSSGVPVPSGVPSGVPYGSGVVGPSGAAPLSGRPSGSGLPPLSAAGALAGAPTGVPTGAPMGSAAAPSGPRPSGGPMSGFAPFSGRPSGQPSGSGLSPVSAAGAQAISLAPNATTAPAEVVTQTLYTTSMHTVLSCAPSITNCPFGNQSISTEYIPTATTLLTRPLSSGVALGAATGSGVAALSAASVAALSGAPSSSSVPVELVTETVYATNLHTVLSCAASVTNCPSRNATSVSTEIVPVSTTVSTRTLSAGVTAAAVSSNAAITAPPSSTAEGEQTTLTVQVTQLNTVVSCAASITSCPAATATSEISALQSSLGYSAIQTVVVTNTIGETTTICPVTAAQGISSSVAASLSSAVMTTTISGSPSYYISSAPPAATQTAAETTILSTSIVQVPSVVTVTVGGVATTSSTLVASTSTFSIVSSIAQNAASAPEPSATVISVGQTQSVVTVTVSGVESASTSVGQITRTVTIPQSALASETSSVEAQGVQPSSGAIIYETVTSQLPVETVITVTLGSQGTWPATKHFAPPLPGPVASNYFTHR